MAYDETVAKLTNLLAVLHRDGGHRVADVGLNQACIEAHDILATLRKDLDAAQYDLAELQNQLKTTQVTRDALASQLVHTQADADQAVHNEAFTERIRIATWLRRVPRAAKYLIGIEHSNVLARLADDIEVGQHLRNL